jgi:hypothetical protein
MDEFGFEATFALFDRSNSLAIRNNVLELSYTGDGEVDGRPTYVLTRRLPYEGENGPYPDAKLVVHFDQEWLVPTAVFSYADADEKELLGSYVFTKVELNPGLTDGDFKF